ncbi:hypothetical protein MNBD_GAMMA15-651 [hydrothermal vent metagenome]|uniref:Glycosyltransferase n=1 Tax=hydrothermal vent metagenome TaxID=652676 RepID=A0A3B0YWG3_9ZZZZ
MQLIHGLYLGGAENVVANIARQADRNRFDMQICCLKEKGVLGEQLESEGVRVLLPEKASGLLGKLRALKQLIVSEQPDLIHSHGTAALLNIGPACMTGVRVPLIHTYHFGNYPHISKPYLWSERIFSRLARRCVAVSESQKAAVIEHLYVQENKVDVVLNGVPENPYRGDSGSRAKARSEFGYSDDEIVIGCIAVLSRQKGVNYLLESARELLERDIRLRFLIVGGGHLEQELRDQCSAYGLDKKIQFTGWRSDALRLLGALDIFILPSLWEGLPMVLLEAMATELPIVVTDVADNRYIIDDGVSGLIIPPENSSAISEAILRLAGDMSAARAMGQAAYTTYQARYSDSVMVEQYQSLYEADSIR